MVGNDLGEDGAMALSARCGPQIHVHVAVRVNSQDGRLHLLDAGRLYTTRHADPDVRATGLTLARGGVVHSIEGGLEQRRIIAAVVDHRPAAQTQIAGGVRHLLWLDQVAPADFGRIEIERRARRSIKRSTMKLPTSRPPPRMNPVGTVLV